MKTKLTRYSYGTFCDLVILTLNIITGGAYAMPPEVSNVRASQREGAQLVDLYYDLASSSNVLTVCMEFSTNGGATYTPLSSGFTGAVGTGVTPGKNKKITCDYGDGWPANVQFRVMASDTPAPAGMVVIPPGSFTMGNCMNPNEGDNDELPTHTVYVSTFYMDKYDVTKALWDRVCKWATNNSYSFAYGVQEKAKNHPAMAVTWYDAVKWCNARSEMEGRMPAYYTDADLKLRFRSGRLTPFVDWNNGFRLPTEAEWEKAARGGVAGRRFPCGDTISWSQANYYSYPAGYAYDFNSMGGNYPAFNDRVYPFTSPVDYFSPNGYGLYDMAGNVWQWCWDWYGAYSSNSQTNPLGPVSGFGRVFRGGGWSGNAFRCRVASRYYYYPTYQSIYIGFRSVLPGDR